MSAISYNVAHIVGLLLVAAGVGRLFGWDWAMLVVGGLVIVLNTVSLLVMFRGAA